MFRDRLPQVFWLPRGFEFLSGLPEIKRRGRPVLVFQAYFDDSGTKGSSQVLFLGGLFGTAERLALFAEEWDREMRARVPLPIRYFKSDEARDLSGEFAYWRRKARDEKLQRLASVVDRDDLYSIFGGVDLAAHKQMEAAIGTIVDAKKHPLNQPYLFALLTVMFEVGREMHRRQSNDRVEVIFDDNAHFRAVAKEQYALAREIVTDDVRKHLPIEPLFRDDKDFVVLQAADLLVGHFRMTVERDAKWPGLELKRLRCSGKHHWAGSIGSFTARQIEKRLNLLPGSLRVSVSRPDESGKK